MAEKRQRFEETTQETAQETQQPRKLVVVKYIDTYYGDDQHEMFILHGEDALLDATQLKRMYLKSRFDSLKTVEETMDWTGPTALIFATNDSDEESSSESE